MIWSMGMGKSALAARSIAYDLQTLGISAAFIEGGTILHGGMGAIQNGDTVYFFSESGQTVELTTAARALSAHRPDAKLIAVVTDGLSVLADICCETFLVSKARDESGLPATTFHMMKLARQEAIRLADLQGIRCVQKWSHPANSEPLHAGRPDPY